MTWVPPTGGPGVGPAQSPADPPPAPEPATPSAAPVAPTAAPVAASDVPVVATAARTGLSNGWVVGIAVVGAIFAGSLIGGVGTGISNAVNPAPTWDPFDSSGDDAYNGGDYSALAQGEPGDPSAVTPMECATACFDESSLEAVTLDGDVVDDYTDLEVSLGVTSAQRTTADHAHAEDWSSWNDSGYSPDECFVTWSYNPIVEAEGEAPPHDAVVPIGDFGSDASGTELTQTVRLFADTEAAAQYMLSLDAGLDACPRFEDSNGYAADVVTREPGLHPPDSIAALGFVASEGGVRYYAMDLQRGNMVIRSVAYSDGGIDDTRFRQLMQKQMSLLEDLAPVPAG